MRIKLVVIFISILTIFNAFSIAFLYFDLVTINAPETTVRVEIVEMNSDEIVLCASLNINNPNDFEIVVKDIELVTTTLEGEKFAYVKIKGGNIPSNGDNTFTETFSIDFNNNAIDELKTSMTGTVGIKSSIIEKTIPITANIVTVIGNAINNLAAPNICVYVDFGEITQEGVNISMFFDVYNTNAFDVKIEDTFVTMETETGEKIGNFEFKDGILFAEKSLNLSGNGTISIQTLNEEKIIVNINSILTARIANFSKSMPFYMKTIVEMPDLKDLLSSKLPTDIILKNDFKATLRGLICYIALEAKNPNKIDLVAKDIVFGIYRIDQDERQLLSQCKIEDGVLKAENLTILKGEAFIPYHKLFIPPPGKKIIPDWFEVDVRGNATIKGLDDYFWLGIVAIQDLHPFREEQIFN